MIRPGSGSAKFPERNRLIYFFLIVIVVIAGIASRRYSNELPWFIAEYSGDTLWALVVFFITGLFFIKYSTMRIALTALIFSFAIELSQLYQADWINEIRNTTAGGLVLGYGFLWTDLICYAVGIFIGVSLEKIFTRKTNIKH